MVKREKKIFKVGNETSPIINEFKVWLNSANGAEALASHFIEHLEATKGKLSELEKEEVINYANNHVKEIMAKAFAD